MTVMCATVTCALSGLAPDTVYKVFVAATNTTSGFPTPPSPPVIITTLPNVTPAVIAQAVSSIAIDVTVSPAFGTSGPYTVTATPLAGGSPIAVTCIYPYNCTITGLAPGTTFSVTATAIDVAGNPTPASLPSTITTPASG